MITAAQIYAELIKLELGRFHPFSFDEELTIQQLKDLRDTLVNLAGGKAVKIIHANLDSPDWQSFQIAIENPS